MSDESLTQRTSASVLWLTAQKWVSRLGSLATIVILTRVLAPEHFGLAAAATTLLPLIYVLSDVGFSTYIVQAERVDQRTLSTAFWFSVSSGTVLFIGVMVAAPALGLLLSQPDVVPLLQVMALSVLMIAVSSVPISLLRRRMQFRSLAFMEVSGALFAQVVAVATALLGAGAWALVLQVMAAQAVATVWVWATARWHPTFTFSRPRFREMFGFGIHVVGSSLAQVVRSWAETAIIVAGLGVRQMGYLNIAQRLVLTAQDLTVSALLPVSTVAFSKVKSSPARLRSSYLRAASIAYVVVTPLMVFVAVSATVLVPFLFGADKFESASVMPALAVVVVIGVGWAVDQGLHLGIGKPGRWFAYISISALGSLAALAAFVQYGLVAVASLWVLTASVESAVRCFMVGRLIDVAPWRVALPLLGVVPPAAAAAIAGLGVMWLAAPLPAILSLAITGLTVVGTYLLSLRFMRPSLFAEIVTVLPSKIRRLLLWTLPRQDRGGDESDDGGQIRTEANS